MRIIRLKATYTNGKIVYVSKSGKSLSSKEVRELIANEYEYKVEVERSHIHPNLI